MDFRFSKSSEMNGNKKQNISGAWREIGIQTDANQVRVRFFRLVKLCENTDCDLKQ